MYQPIDPYATLVAIRRHLSQSQYPYLGRALDALENSYYYLYQNPVLVPDYMVIRYEDLVAQPRETVERVAEFLDVRFSESLLEPTVLGSPWAGNSTSGQRFEGISTLPLRLWKPLVTPLEIAVVNRLFGHVLHDHGYERIVSPRSVYRPCPGERPKIYLANRLYWKLMVASRTPASDRRQDAQGGGE